MKKITAIFAILAMLALLPACGKTAQSTQDEQETAPSEAHELHHVQLTIEDYGTITLELDATAAPITVENFLNLASQGFYDGRTFHRIMQGFMMQGGADEAGSVAPIKGEFSANGVENDLQHLRGAISMARTPDPDSASSQFFICQVDCPHLDGNYACFGYVTDGIEVVDAVCDASEPIDNNGTIAAEEQPVIASLRVID